MAKTQINLRLEEDLDRRLENLAKRTGRTKSFYAAKAIGDFLEEQEDYYLAKDSLDEFRESGDDVLSIEEIRWGSTGQ